MQVTSLQLGDGVHTEELISTKNRNAHMPSNSTSSPGRIHTLSTPEISRRPEQCIFPAYINDIHLLFLPCRSNWKYRKLALNDGIWHHRERFLRQGCCCTRGGISFLSAKSTLKILYTYLDFSVPNKLSMLNVSCHHTTPMHVTLLYVSRTDSAQTFRDQS